MGRSIEGKAADMASKDLWLAQESILIPVAGWGLWLRLRLDAVPQ